MKSEIKIRPARVEDFADIHNFNTSCLGYEYDPRKTKKRLEDILGASGEVIFIAEIEGRPIGYVHACDYDCTYADSLKSIKAIAVLESERGCGVGRLLLEAAERWAVQTGSAGVRLVSSFSRETAHSFYEACGYRYRKNQKNFIKMFF